MDVVHILLGCPWLYNHDATNHGHDNTSIFNHPSGQITLNPTKPKELTSPSKKTPVPL